MSLAAAAALVVAVGGAVLIGWTLEIPSLQSVLPGFVTMKANTAVGFVLAGSSLALLGRADRSMPALRLSQAAAGAVAVVGLLNIWQYLFGMDLGIDQLLFREPAGTVGTLAPGRMAPATAVDFCLVGAALLLAGSGRMILAAQRVALLTGLIGLLALTGYLYGAPNLYGIGHYTQMAVHTAAAFVILAIGILLVHPAEGLMRMIASDTMGRWLLRRMMPFAIVVPLVLGLLRVEGEDRGYFEAQFGVALMMMVLVVVLGNLVWWTSRALSGVDQRRRVSERELRDSREFLNKIINCIRDPIFVMDDRHRYILMNDAGCDLTGRTRQDILGQTTWELYPPEVARELLERNEKVLASGLDDVTEEQLPDTQGGTLTVDTKKSLFVDGLGGRYVVGIVRDITSRKQIEEDLARERGNLKAIFEASPVGMLLMDDSAVVRAVNDVAVRLAGKSVAEMINRQPGDALGCVHASDHAGGCGAGPCCSSCPIRAAIEGVLKSGQAARRVEVQVVLYVGGSKVRPWLEINSEPMMIDGRRHVIASIVNITERKQAEKDINQARDNAEHANAAKSRFLANMSHEIRTPMTAILGFAEILGSSIECCDKCPERSACLKRVENREHVRTICRNGRHLLGLINDILDLSKIEAGKMDMESVACSAVGIVEEVVSLMRVRAVEKGLSLHARYEFPLPQTILSDGAKVRQVLMNLVGNAVKFTHKGHVELVARYVGDVPGGRASIVFEVKDTGIGMTPEQIGRLFQPFAQADSSTTRQFGGTGLGLAISKRLAEALGGGIDVQSRPGEGSAFSFTMEAVLPKPALMLNDLSEAALPSGGGRPLCPTTTLRGRVLLAEDGPDNRMLICTILRNAGAEVATAVNGRLAVQKALSARAGGTPYDAILMDMQMPETDGYEATRQLRRAGYDGPIIALTAHAMSEDRGKCLAAGCDDYATKPVDRASLLSMLARLMGNAASGPAEASVVTAGPETACDNAVRSQFADDPEMMDVVDAFITRLPATLKAMSDALANSCTDELRRLAHQLKGAGGGYGYPSLTQQALKLEDAAKAADIEAARLALYELSILTRAVIAGRKVGAVPEETE